MILITRPPTPYSILALEFMQWIGRSWTVIILMRTVEYQSRLNKILGDADLMPGTVNFGSETCEASEAGIISSIAWKSIRLASVDHRCLLIAVDSHLQPS